MQIIDPSDPESRSSAKTEEFQEGYLSEGFENGIQIAETPLA